MTASRKLKISNHFGNNKTIRMENGNESMS
jgi:hypothetical protein